MLVPGEWAETNLLMKEANKPWTRFDTARAREQFELLLEIDKFVYDTKPHGVFANSSPARLAQDILNIASLYSQGNITTTNFLNVVHDISGGR